MERRRHTMIDLAALLRCLVSVVSWWHIVALGLVGVGLVVPDLVLGILLHSRRVCRLLEVNVGWSHWIKWLRNGRLVRGVLEAGLRLFAGVRGDSSTGNPKAHWSRVNAVAIASGRRQRGTVDQRRFSLVYEPN